MKHWPIVVVPILLLGILLSVPRWGKINETVPVEPVVFKANEQVIETVKSLYETSVITCKTFRILKVEPDYLWCWGPVPTEEDFVKWNLKKYGLAE